jgi:hypothetical protein
MLIVISRYVLQKQTCTLYLSISSIQLTSSQQTILDLLPRTSGNSCLVHVLIRTNSVKIFQGAKYVDPFSYLILYFDLNNKSP